MFPHCHTVYVDVSNSQQQQLAAVVLNSFMGSPQHSAEQGNAPLDAAFAPDSPAPADGHAGRCGSAVTAGAAAVELQEDPGPQEEQQCQVVAGGQGCRVLPRVWLAAVPRSFHCRARQDCPCAPAGKAYPWWTGCCRLGCDGCLDRHCNWLIFVAAMQGVQARATAVRGPATSTACWIHHHELVFRPGLPEAPIFF